MIPMGAWMIGHLSFNLSVRALDGHMLRLSPAKKAGRWQSNPGACRASRSSGSTGEGQGTRVRACTAVTCIESRYRKCAHTVSMLTHASTAQCSR